MPCRAESPVLLHPLPDPSPSKSMARWPGHYPSASGHTQPPVATTVDAAQCERRKQLAEKRRPLELETATCGKSCQFFLFRLPCYLRNPCRHLPNNLNPQMLRKGRNGMDLALGTCGVMATDGIFGGSVRR